LFVITRFAAKLWHSRQGALAEQWRQRAEASLNAGRGEEAVEGFRRALTYSRDNALYQLRLAQALLSAQRADEARPYLLNLWQREPGNGNVNLELARLAARQGDVSEAVRYFHQAIYGVWTEDPESQRREARLEFCEFLLSRKRNDEAQAALIELASDLPKDAGLYTRVGALFLRAEDHQRALETFRQALRLDASHSAALVGAGEAAFHLGNYRIARRYLERAGEQAAAPPRATELLTTTRIILAIDPFQRGLSGAERARRADQAFRQALAHVEQCALDRGEVLDAGAPQTALQAAYARAMTLRPKVRPRALRRDPDLLTNTMEVVFEIEELAARDCGTPTDADLALLLIGRQQGGRE